MRKLSLILLTLLTLHTAAQDQDSADFVTIKKSYFPVETFHSSNRWYSSQLSALNEPVLYSDSSEVEIYRFTWLRTFHNPIAIRIEKKGETYQLFWKVCDGRGGYHPGKLTIDKQKSIDKVMWDNFKDLLKQTAFFQMSSVDPRMGGHDGAQWILEGKNSKKYHATERWTPDKTSDYYKCCDFLIFLSELNIPQNSKY